VSVSVFSEHDEPEKFRQKYSTYNKNDYLCGNQTLKRKEYESN
jgi:hypothetical protein